MSVTLKILILLLNYQYYARGNYLRGFSTDSDIDESKLEEVFKKSRSTKRSPAPLELGFVTFELNQRQSQNAGIPAIVRQNNFVKHIPIVPKSGSVTAISTDKGPKNGHLLVPLHGQHVILPIFHNIELIHHDQDHVVVEHKPMVLSRQGQTTLILEHKPIVISHPQRKTIIVHPKTVVLDATKSILMSPKSQIHEIIVHRHDSKTIVHPVNEKNLFRSHYGGYGVGLDYGGHGAGHGFYVPMI